MSPFIIYEKNEHFKRAKELLNADCPHQHRYACLELRFCIEAITYQILLSGIKNIPDSIINTWEPNKAMKMLAEFNKLSVSDCELSIALGPSKTPPGDGWLKIGEQKVPNIKWLNNAYNKLGSFVHLPQPKNVTQTKTIVDSVRPIADKLEEYLSGNLIIQFNNAEIAKCPGCKSDFIFDIRKIQEGDIRRCLSSKCGISMIATKRESKKITFEYNIFDINMPFLRSFNGNTRVQNQESCFVSVPKLQGEILD